MSEKKDKNKDIRNVLIDNNNNNEENKRYLFEPILNMSKSKLNNNSNYKFMIKNNNKSFIERIISGKININNNNNSNNFIRKNKKLSFKENDNSSLSKKKK